MQQKMPAGALTLGTWMGPLSGLMVFIAFIPLMHIFPPPNPTMPMADYAAMIRGNRIGFLVGGLLEMCAAPTMMMFIAAIAIFMKRIEGEWPFWTYTMLLTACMGYATVWFDGLFFSVTAFRPDFSDETIYAWVTGSFFLMVIPAFVGTVQYIATGICLLKDNSPRPLLPRWLGYLNIWVGVLSLPGQLCSLFMRGPFSWNGVLAFWLAAAVFGIWINAMMIMMLKAAKRIRQEGL